MKRTALIVTALAALFALTTAYSPGGVGYVEYFGQWGSEGEGDGGGVAYLGNTAVGHTTGSLDVMKYFFKRLLVDGNYVIGYPQVWSRADLCAAYGTPHHDAYTCNLGGDPTMEVWSDDPGSLSLTYSWSEHGVLKDLRVHVKDSANNDVEGAKVCLWQTMYYLTNTTGDGGRCTFKDLLFGFDDGKLTATKHNYKPALEDDVVVGEQ